MDSDSTKKIAFAAAVFAGFAYFSLSALRDVFNGNYYYLYYLFRLLICY